MELGVQFYTPRAGTIFRFRRDLFGQANCVRTQCPAGPIKLPSEGIMSSMRLTVTGLYGLVAMGLIIVFLRGPF
jgi:hypothetical protein